MEKQYILVVNLRRLVKEAYISLQAIKIQGYCILLLATELPNYCQNIVDQFVAVDTSSYPETMEKVRQLAKKLAIVGVVAFTETAVEISSCIAAELHLPGNPTEAVHYARNKVAMRQQLLNAEIAQVPFIHLRDLRLTKMAIQAIGYPVVIKPINTSGSTGIFYLTGDEDILKFTSNAQSLPNPNYDPISRTDSIEFIVEKYIEGLEVSVEGLVFSREILICGITDKLTTLDYKIEYQHIFPTIFTIHQKNIIEQTVKKIITCLGFNNCSFHLEGKFCDDQFQLIEVAARPAGGYIASHLIPYATQRNYYADLVKIAVGLRPECPYTSKFYSGLRFILAAREGIFSRIHELDSLIRHPLLHSFFIEVDFGSLILLPPKDYRLVRLFAYMVNGFSYIEVADALSELAHLAHPDIV